ncbi:PREDICTED: uncharacterized protein LOC104824029 [Tarenaya hassleriana]|uniref:uncharacterized protein LOC104824029 n=1 Tax=Tarenaya hassleriana TaxID=28532 RepID=UPI00053C3B2E|nr:PREDICTED: uncharacterized protein LOC104824029 [Tarenaya hassleriana]XP_010554231.1 PREDICTED: uncharacterized protein LOC104824029 [Tarenaya hassleriana]XP_010554232.1 PREDICTED: uncharacterized protein LOC104824029 [Tarenaya hassleriana]
MNSCGIQRNAFAAGDEVRGSSITVAVYDRWETVVCPKPRRIGVLNSVNAHPQPVQSLRSQLSNKDELSDSNPASDLMDIILRKVGGAPAEQDCPDTIASSPLFFPGSPPGRVPNPLTQDSRFRDGVLVAPSPPLSLHTALPPSSPPSGRTGSCIRSNFGNNPKVRVVGFDRLDRRDRRSIPSLA